MSEDKYFGFELTFEKHFRLGFFFVTGSLLQTNRNIFFCNKAPFMHASILKLVEFIN